MRNALQSFLKAAIPGGGAESSYITTSFDQKEFLTVNLVNKTRLDDDYEDQEQEDDDNPSALCLLVSPPPYDSMYLCCICASKTQGIFLLESQPTSLPSPTERASERGTTAYPVMSYL